MAAWYRGLDHHPISRLIRPAVSIAAPPTRVSLIVAHRARVTLWLQASRKVPESSSWAIRGAPQNRPMTTGTRYMIPIHAKRISSV